MLPTPRRFWVRVVLGPLEWPMMFHQCAIGASVQATAPATSTSVQLT
jgi:hypothetical protein